MSKSRTAALPKPQPSAARRSHEAGSPSEPPLYPALFPVEGCELPPPDCDDPALYERKPLVVEQLMHSYRTLASGYRMQLEAATRGGRAEVIAEYGERLVAEVTEELKMLGVHQFCLQDIDAIPETDLAAEMRRVIRMKRALEARSDEIAMKLGGAGG